MTEAPRLKRVTDAMLMTLPPPDDWDDSPLAALAAPLRFPAPKLAEPTLLQETTSLVVKDTVVVSTTVAETDTPAESAITTELVASGEKDTVVVSTTVAEKDTVAESAISANAFVVAEKGTVVVSTTVSEKDTVVEPAVITESIATTEIATTEKDTVAVSTTVAEKNRTTKTAAPARSATVVEKDTVAVSRLERVRHATKVQDGHSTGEQCLYAAMWEQGRSEGRNSRTITAGWDRLGKIANLTDKNAKIACLRLIDKLAVQVIAPEDCNTRTGRTYRIWAWIPLLERRADVGMEWYVKTRGVEFVRPPNSAPQAQARWDRFHGEKGTVVVSATVVKTGTVTDAATVGEKGTETVVVSTLATPYMLLSKESSVSLPSSSSTSSLVQSVVRAAQPHLTIDDELARTALSKVGQLRIHQAEHFSRLAAVKVANQKNSTNPSGLWVTQFANYATGTTLQLYDEQVAREREQYKGGGLPENIWRGVLSNPDASEDDKALARRILDV